LHAFNNGLIVYPTGKTFENLFNHLIVLLYSVPSALKSWKTTDVLIVDECSMLDPILFDKVRNNETIVALI